MSIFGSLTTAGGGARNTSPVTTGSTLNTALGDLLIVGVGWSDTGTCTGVSDTAGNSFSTPGQQNNVAGSFFQWFYCLAATHANAANTFSATFSDATNNNTIIFVWDVPLTGGSALFDVAAPYDGAGDHTTAVYSTTGSDEFVAVEAYDQFAGGGYAAQVSPAYTLDSSSFGTFGGAEHIVFASAQTNIQSGFSAGSGGSGASAIGFKAAPPPLTVTATDSVSFSESLTENTTAARAVTDSESFSETLARAVAVHRAISDSGSFSDTAVREIGFGESLADMFTVSDSIGIVIGHFAAINIFGFSPNYYFNQHSAGLAIYLSPGEINGKLFLGQVVFVPNNATTNISIDVNGNVQLIFGKLLYPIATVVTGPVTTSTPNTLPVSSPGVISITDQRPTTPFSFT